MLTYAGDGARCNTERGNESNCNGDCCHMVYEQIGRDEYNSDLTECSQFPFESTIEGGSGARIRCLSGWQNELKNLHINSFYANNNLSAGDQFIVRVTGLDCAVPSAKDPSKMCSGPGFVIPGAGSLSDRSSVPALRPRLLTPTRTSSRVRLGSETRIRRTLDNKTDVVIVSFGNLKWGMYRAMMWAGDGRLAKVAVRNASGEIPPLNDTSSLDPLYAKSGMSWDWDWDWSMNGGNRYGGAGIIAETSSQTVNLTYWLLSDSETSGSQDPDWKDLPEEDSGAATATGVSVMMVIVAGAVSAMLF